MEDDFLIDVSGKLSGGTANIGGSFQGKDRNLLASQLTRITKGGTIEASALESGDGGEVIIWSDKVTEFFAHTNAKGGNLVVMEGLLKYQLLLQISPIEEQLIPQPLMGTWECFYSIRMTL